MSWLQTFLQPTQSYLVAFDIASSSQNYLNPNGLQRDRERLFEAIDQAKLVRRCASKSAVGGQFLGDEYRVAFRVDGDHGTIRHSDIIEFIDEVFDKLEGSKSSMGYAPVVRALLTMGAVSASELYGFGYLKGGTAFDALSKLSQLVGKEINLLASNLDLGDGSGLEKETLNDGSVFLKRYTSRSAPEPYGGSPANNSCQHFFVISLTNTNHQTDDSLIDYAKTIVNRVKKAEDQGGGLGLTIGPSSVVFAIPEASFSRSKVVLENIRQAATDYPYPIAAAIGAGLGQLVAGSDWVSSSFESGTAIELCRISSQLDPGSLAMPRRDAVSELLGPLPRQVTRSIKIEGKRSEKFEALVNDNYFTLSNEPSPTGGASRIYSLLQKQSEIPNFKRAWENRGKLREHYKYFLDINKKMVPWMACGLSVFWWVLHEMKRNAIADKLINQNISYICKCRPSEVKNAAANLRTIERDSQVVEHLKKLLKKSSSKLNASLALSEFKIIDSHFLAQEIENSNAKNFMLIVKAMLVDKEASIQAVRSLLTKRFIDDGIEVDKNRFGKLSAAALLVGDQKLVNRMLNLLKDNELYFEQELSNQLVQLVDPQGPGDEIADYIDLLDDSRRHPDAKPQIVRAVGAAIEKIKQ